MSELNKKENSFASKSVVVLLILLCAVGVASTVATIFFNETNTVINEALDLAFYILIVLYFLKFYKKPHSNSLRYILFFLALVTAYNGLSYKPISDMFAYALITTSLIIAFVSARLNKFNQNRWILLFGFILLLFGTIYCISTIPSDLVDSYSSFEKTMYLLSFINPILQYTCISLSYLARCYRHIQAGETADEEEEI